MNEKEITKEIKKLDEHEIDEWINMIGKKLRKKNRKNIIQMICLKRRKYPLIKKKKKLVIFQ